jgi:hypothetical protein
MVCNKKSWTLVDVFGKLYIKAFILFLGCVSIARGCRAQLFVLGKLVRLFTVFVSSIEAWQPRAAVDRSCSSVLARST